MNVKMFERVQQKNKMIKTIFSSFRIKLLNKLDYNIIIIA